jgi:hypothetical protein
VRDLIWKAVGQCGEGFHFRQFRWRTCGKYEDEGETMMGTNERSQQPQTESKTDASVEERQNTWLKSLLTEYFDEELKKSGAAPIEK